MWTLVLMVLLFVVTPSFAEQNFSEQYERGYNIFNPASQYAPDNPLNPAQAFGEQKVTGYLFGAHSSVNERSVPPGRCQSN